MACLCRVVLVGVVVGVVDAGGNGWKGDRRPNHRAVGLSRNCGLSRKSGRFVGGFCLSKGRANLSKDYLDLGQ